VSIEGYIFDAEVKTLRSERQLLIFKVTDYTSSITIKKFSRNETDEQLFSAIKKGLWVRVRGSIQEDSFMKDLTMNAYDIMEVDHADRQDTATDKRVELHLHTNMSTMDATNGISDLVGQAAKWGHPAVAVTDHAGLQAFPEAHAAGKKNGIKTLFGVEANLVDDGVPIGYNSEHRPLKGGKYVIFDVETTGLSAIYDKVIELSAVKMENGNVIDQFEEFIDPGFPLSETTINLTSITDEMVRGSMSEKEVFTKFREFYEDAIIVGHNVTFDIGFMNTGYLRHGMEEIKNPIIDTLTLARFLYPTLKGYRLNTLAKKFGVALEHHHRAIYDSETTGHLCYLFLKDAEERYGIEYHDQLNDHMTENEAYKHARPSHAILIAKTQAGLKNLFKLVSMSNVKYYYRVPRIPRSELEKLREGIIVGSACSSGDVFTAMMQKGYADARRKAKFYDYLEVMPKPVYQPLIEQELVSDNKKLEEIIANIVKLGEDLDIPVVATGDVHYLNPQDYIYRKILINSQGGANPLNRSELPDVHFRTTDEMLEDFSFLGPEVAHKIVVENSNKIADSVDDGISPVKDKLYTPKMPGAEDRIKQLSMDRAHALYGEVLPEIVQERLDKELTSIIGNGFSVIYLIAQRLVHKSNKDGYLVGSRGSVGSSFVATMSGITEVNPLPPHYRCPKCQYSFFYTKGEYGSGYDLPDKECPECGTWMIGDGQDIPFETFLGFKGDKVPDIDLNFSGDYQPIAHNYMQVLFGKDNVFRAGTIGTVADKTAFGYVKAYERDTNQHLRGAEIERLAKGATGVKRTTGQHPAGILIVPDYMDVYDFSPIQYPADDQTAAWETTHFDFHSIHDNILKMDILGHDDPTMIRKLQDLSGIDPETIPTDDPGVMKIFSGPEVLGVDENQIQSKTGTLGIPEFGTRFVRGMLEETHPTSYSELLQISGLSHGTDVWLGNAEELIKAGTVTLKEVIGCRDNIMMDLIHYGLDSQSSFQIMESVRKGKGIPEGYEDKMRAANVPDWYIESCGKIKYMFPRAHASAYVLMALRIAYFKVYYPLVYYAAYFTVRADDFDIVSMARGKESLKNRMQEINDKGNDASTKEKNLLTVLELANEMLERGFEFKMIDIEKSDAEEWLIEGKSLIAPFNALPGLGLNVAKQIVAARADKPFLSKEDLSKRGHVSQTLIDFMTENNVLSELPDENQLSLF
jgi:DNA polymerase-3 subunit alpha (Gram-positive type)